MDINLLITQLRTHCAVFSGRVAGSVEFKVLEESVNMAVPSAFVIILADELIGEPAQNDVYQLINEGFAVIFCQSNTVEERGQTPAHTYHSIRAAIWSALLGWKPTSYHRGVTYRGAKLLGLDRARVWYQLDFGTDYQIGPEDGWQSNPANTITGAAAPNYTALHLNVDMIDPAANPNPGPDGRIEAQADFNISQT